MITCNCNTGLPTNPTDGDGIEWDDDAYGPGQGGWVAAPALKASDIFRGPLQSDEILVFDVDTSDPNPANWKSQATHSQIKVQMENPNASGIAFNLIVPDPQMNPTVDIDLAALGGGPHAPTHATGGSDPLTPASIGAVADGDARLSDARTPTAHAASHSAGGADALINFVQGTNSTGVWAEVDPTTNAAVPAGFYSKASPSSAPRPNERWYIISMPDYDNYSVGLQIASGNVENELWFRSKTFGVWRKLATEPATDTGWTPVPLTSGTGELWAKRAGDLVTLDIGVTSVATATLPEQFRPYRTYAHRQYYQAIIIWQSGTISGMGQKYTQKLCITYRGA